MTSLHGTIQVPGDKSISHRSIIFGAISNGTTHVDHFLTSADCLSTMKAFQSMDVQIEQAADQLTIHGTGHLTPPTNRLDMGNSGTTTRLLSGLLAGQHFTSTLFGDASLSKRPMQRIVIPLTKMGASIESTQEHLPLTIHGNQLHGIEYEMPIASAQVKSAIILAALNATGPTKIIEPLASRDHTERMLAQFSPDSIAHSGNQITITPRQPLTGQLIEVPGDISSAAFFMVAAAIIKDSKVTIKNVGINPTRTGIINVLKRAGVQIEVTNRRNGVEPSADLTVTAGPIKPFEVGAAEVPGLIDEVPLLALLAAKADGVSKITGATELRYKESDRIAVIAAEFKKLGIAITELPDGFVIDGRKEWHLNDAHLDAHLDHRIAMVLKIATLLIPRPVTIEHLDSIRISYPSFLTGLQQITRR